MVDWTTLVTTLGPSLVSGTLAYLAARHQAKSALQVAKEQQDAELKKLKEQQKAEFEKLKEQQNAEIEKIKEQQNAEIQKIREQSLREIERIKVEMEKQAELYERNAQTDVVKYVFDRLLNGDMSVLENLENLIAAFDKLNKKIESETFINYNNPANKRR
ncbi:MAG: hypothetical protein C0P72_011435 [Clostridia bacterium]